MIRAVLRVPAALLTLAVFLATGIGLPVHHHADHDGDTTHLSSGEHGHGHGVTLVVRDMRTERPGTPVDVPGVFAVRAVPEPPAVEGRWTPGTPSTPRGRSPPSFTRARAPPSSS